MMRFIAAFSLLLVVATFSHGQETGPRQSQPTDLTIVRYSWNEERVPGWENQRNGPEPFDVMIQRISNEQRLQQARNARNPAAVNRSQTEAQLIEQATVTNNNKTKKDLPRFGYRYRVRVRNDSIKTIKTIDWDYVFVDKEIGQEVSRRLFTSDETIHPHKEKELSVFILSPPTRTVTTKAVVRKDDVPFAEQIEVVRILYSDGTSWQKPQ